MEGRRRDEGTGGLDEGFEGEVGDPASVGVGHDPAEGAIVGDARVAELHGAGDGPPAEGF